MMKIRVIRLIRPNVISSDNLWISEACSIRVV